MKPNDPPPSNGTVEPDDREYAVRFDREPAKVVAHYGYDNARFRPTIRDLVDELKTRPKQFPKKRGKLKEARAAALRFNDGTAWRAVFTVDERSRVVRILSIESHDAAYRSARRR